MGSCFSSTTSTTEDSPKVAKTSARSSQNKLRTLAMRDIKGFKKSDSIENFYDIQKTIGIGIDNIILNNSGAFGEVVKAVHLLTNQVRAIKVIEK